MSDGVWKGRACSGIPKNVGGSIKENTWQHLMFAKTATCPEPNSN
jgi:hypothetical protein